MKPLHLPEGRARRVGRSLLRAAGILILLMSSLPASGMAFQTAADDTLSRWQPPAIMGDHVRGLVAARWNIPPEDLRLEWARPRGADALAELAKPELLGSGKNGRWVVTFEDETRPGRRLSAQLRTGVSRLLAFAKVPIARGERLHEGNMEFLPGIHWGPVADLPPVAEEGWEAQRRIDAGEVLTTPTVRPPLLVVSGRPVRLEWTSGRLRISLQGKAVGSAALGERVFVRTDEGRRMAGIVTGPSTVLLSNPGTGE